MFIYLSLHKYFSFLILCKICKNCKLVHSFNSFSSFSAFMHIIIKNTSQNKINFISTMLLFTARFFFVFLLSFQLFTIFLFVFTYFTVYWFIITITIFAKWIILAFSSKSLFLSSYLLTTILFVCIWTDLISSFLLLLWFLTIFLWFSFF